MAEYRETPLAARRYGVGETGDGPSIERRRGIGWCDRLAEWPGARTSSIIRDNFPVRTVVYCRSYKDVDDYIHRLYNYTRFEIFPPLPGFCSSQIGRFHGIHVF
jgi:hypothetical protein